ncbi:uncharacterized protein LOC125038984 [Penaeus chinensis]|uniref:uncharacterized protein LOC125038984 n=1 Tax=Penaeus chinensis TaxID=139456 RepID=UPI001FB752D4|nr:uncharacterized protein LOC125038984 [Penaeus chinensis]
MWCFAARRKSSERRTWRGGAKKKRNEDIKSEDRVYVLERGVQRKHMDARPTTARSEFRYLGSTVQSDGGVEAEISRRIQSGWTNWKKMAGVMCDKRVPARVKGKIHRT